MGTTKKYSWVHSLVQKVAASKPGALISSRITASCGSDCFSTVWSKSNIFILDRRSAGCHADQPGAKSGLLRTVPLLCIRDENDSTSFALIATNWGQKSYPAWYYNLKANPEAVCSIAGKANKYLAHEAQGEEYERFWQYASNTYFGYPLYKQRIAGRRIPIMVMGEIDK